MDSSSPMDVDCKCSTEMMEECTREMTISVRPEVANFTNAVPIDLHPRQKQLPSFDEEASLRRERLRIDLQEPIPNCGCLTNCREVPTEPGPFYTQLGTAANEDELRLDIENRLTLTGNAIRFEEIFYTGKEAKAKEGCPSWQSTLHRLSVDEKVLVVYKRRQGHSCPYSLIVVALIHWEGILRTRADELYDVFVDKMNTYGEPTPRACATNKQKTCLCQGQNDDTSGASFTFGCAWSEFYGGCKFGNGMTARRFKTKVKESQGIDRELQEIFYSVADDVNPLVQRLAPTAFGNMTTFESSATECRLGNAAGRPFAAVSAVVDFCAHAHRDIRNMKNGLTCVVSLTIGKHRGLSRADDQQLHVLPLYTADSSNTTTMGGVALALGHGSVLLECAKHELHATTALPRPNRQEPSRIGLVFFQHRALNRPNHGKAEVAEKTRLKKVAMENLLKKKAERGRPKAAGKRGRPKRVAKKGQPKTAAKRGQPKKPRHSRILHRGI